MPSGITQRDYLSSPVLPGSNTAITTESRIPAGSILKDVNHAFELVERKHFVAAIKLFNPVCESARAQITSSRHIQDTGALFHDNETYEAPRGYDAANLSTFYT